jgi:hypothetical protein
VNWPAIADHGLSSFYRSVIPVRKIRGGVRLMSRPFARIFTTATLCALTFACAAYMSAQATIDADDLVPTGKGWGEKVEHAPKRDASVSGKARTQCANGICYHGGPVMTGTANVYYIWYGNWTGNSAVNLLEGFIGGLNGSPYENINSTYYNGAGTHVSGNLHFAGSTTDNYSHGTALSDAAIQAIVAAHIGTFNGGQADTNGVYFVLTSKDVNETSGFCTQYCGWHTHGTIGGKDVKYSFVGNPDRCPSACEVQTTGPNGTGGGDGMASIIAHEQEEAISDPDLNAWYDRQGAENADKCAWTFGTELTASNGAKYNVSLNGTKYLIQRNWVNASGGYCALSYP